MPVTDEQMTLLHAYLSGEYEIAETLNREAAAAGAADGIAELVYAAFVIAARQKFSPAWTHADVIRFVARVRADRSDQPDTLDPLAAELQLRGALGETTTRQSPSAEDSARAQVILLEALTHIQNLDEPTRAQPAQPGPQRSQHHAGHAHASPIKQRAAAKAGAAELAAFSNMRTNSRRPTDPKT